jgi:hypothetical protein
MGTGKRIAPAVRFSTPSLLRSPRWKFRLAGRESGRMLLPESPGLDAQTGSGPLSLHLAHALFKIP